MDMLELRQKMFPQSSYRKRLPPMRSISSRYGIRQQTRKNTLTCDPEQYAEYLRLCTILNKTPDPKANRFGEIVMAGIIATMKREQQRNGK